MALKKEEIERRDRFTETETQRRFTNAFVQFLNALRSGAGIIRICRGISRHAGAAFLGVQRSHLSHQLTRSL
jgi:hypothetical protein